MIYQRKLIVPWAIERPAPFTHAACHMGSHADGKRFITLLIQSPNPPPSLPCLASPSPSSLGENYLTLIKPIAMQPDIIPFLERGTGATLFLDCKGWYRTLSSYSSVILLNLPFLVYIFIYLFFNLNIQFNTKHAPSNYLRSSRESVL